MPMHIDTYFQRHIKLGKRVCSATTTPKQSSPAGDCPLSFKYIWLLRTYVELFIAQYCHWISSWGSDYYWKVNNERVPLLDIICFLVEVLLCLEFNGGKCVIFTSTLGEVVMLREGPTFAWCWQIFVSHSLATLSHAGSFGILCSCWC